MINLKKWVQVHFYLRDLAEYRNRMSLHERRVQDEIQERINSDPEIRRIRDLKSLLTLKSFCSFFEVEFCSACFF